MAQKITVTSDKTGALEEVFGSDNRMNVSSRSDNRSDAANRRDRTSDAGGQEQLILLHPRQNGRVRVLPAL